MIDEIGINIDELVKSRFWAVFVIVTMNLMM